jgi:hypothetical protein
MLIKKILFIAGLFLMLPFFVLASDQIFISQWQTASDTSSSQDYIELFNPNSAGFPLDGYVLVKRTKTTKEDKVIYQWQAGDMIPANSFYLLVNPALSGIGEDVATSSVSIAPDNGLAIRYGPLDTGAIITSVAWGASQNDFQNIIASSTSAKSYYKINLYQDDNLYVSPAGTPRNSSIVFLEPTPTSTPNTQTFTPDEISSSTPENISTTSYSTTIKISEIMPNPSGADDGNEEVELFNSGESPVDLAGWLISDSHGTSTAYQLPTSTVISEGAYLAIIIPAGNFSLNNGGDTVNLYYPNSVLADSVSYSVSAGDNEGWQNVGGVWMLGPETLGYVNAAPPVAHSSGSSSSGGSSGASTSNNIISTLEITEFLPNPQGDDEGSEWVELYNFGSEQVNLANWILDDFGSSTPGASAFVLDGSFNVAPKSYLAITIPKGKFTLNNSSKDSVRLFKPGKILFEEISFENPPEGLSFAKAAGDKWQYARATPGKENIFVWEKPEIVISEILPNPLGDDEEFVELYNNGTSTVPLSLFKILIGKRLLNLSSLDNGTSSPFYLKSGEYFILYEDDLPANLSNSGQTVVLEDLVGNEINKVVYAKASKGQAYALGEGESYFWTDKPTPGEKNSLVLGSATQKEEAVIKPKVSSVKQTSKTDLNRENKELLARIDGLENQVLALSSRIDELSPKSYLDEQAKESPALEETKIEKSSYKYVAMSLVALVILAILFWKFFVKGKGD